MNSVPREEFPQRLDEGTGQVHPSLFLLKTWPLLTLVYLSRSDGSFFEKIYIDSKSFKQIKINVDNL